MLRMRMPLVTLIVLAMTFVGVTAALAEEGGDQPVGQYNDIVESYSNVVRVDIQGFAFHPPEIVVAPGTLVIWTNQDSARHNVLLIPSEQNGLEAEVNGPLLGKGESYGLVFHEVGVYNYICAPHPSMKAVVRVEAP